MFDEKGLKKRLAALPAPHRAAFAAACCERMLPNYEAFVALERWGDPNVLRGALDRVWQSLEGRPLGRAQAADLFEACVSVGPDTEDFTSLFVGAAGNAAASVAYTLQCALDGDPTQATLAGRLAVESVFAYLARVNDPETGVHADDPTFDEQLWRYPLMAAELRKQEGDLLTLSRAAALTPALLEELRRSSQRAGIRPFERGLVKRGDGTPTTG